MLICGCVLAIAAPLGIAEAHTHGTDHHTRSGDKSKEVSGLDKEYLKMSMQGDLFEIQGGRIALSRSSDGTVVRLANRLIADHTKSFSDTAEIARELGVDVPDSPSPTQQWELQVIQTFQGKAFNHWYSSLEVQDHLEDIDLTTDEIRDGTNDKVIDDAKTNLPVLQVHLELARQALADNP